MGCFSGRLMSAVCDQKLFCKLCSPFCCSFDEFVEEKVISPSYSSAILTPPLFHFNVWQDPLQFKKKKLKKKRKEWPACVLFRIFMGKELWEVQGGAVKIWGEGIKDCGRIHSTGGWEVCWVVQVGWMEGKIQEPRIGVQPYVLKANWFNHWLLEEPWLTI